MGINIYPVPAFRKWPPPVFAGSLRSPMHLRGLVCQFFMSRARKEVSSIFTISSVGMLVAMVSSVMLTIFLLHLYLPCTITLESRQSFCLVAIFLSVVAPRPFNFRALLGGVGDPWGTCWILNELFNSSNLYLITYWDITIMIMKSLCWEKFCDTLSARPLWSHWRPTDFAAGVAPTGLPHSFDRQRHTHTHSRCCL